MQVKAILLGRNEKGQNLLSVVFDDEGIERKWIPKWDEIRTMFQIAVLTEYTNIKGQKNEELKNFGESAWFTHQICSWTIE